jgi:hypothetical protein
MTWAAMDVHARSTYAASLDVITGELCRQRFDTGATLGQRTSPDPPPSSQGAERALTRSCGLHRLTEGVRMPLTQIQLSTALAGRAGISRAEAKRVLGALEEVVLELLRNAQRCGSGIWCNWPTASSRPRRRAWAATRQRARRSRSRPSQRASTCGQPAGEGQGGAAQHAEARAALGLQATSRAAS